MLSSPGPASESRVAASSPTDIAVLARRAIAEYVTTRNADAIVNGAEFFGPAECGELLAMVANGDGNCVEPAKVIARKLASFVHAPIVETLVESLDPEISDLGCELAFILSRRSSGFDPLIMKACRRRLQADAGVPLQTVETGDLRRFESMLDELFERDWFRSGSVLSWAMRASLHVTETECRRRLLRKLLEGSRRLNGLYGSSAWFVSRSAALFLARDGGRLELSRAGDDDELSAIIGSSQRTDQSTESITAFDAAVELVLGRESLVSSLRESVVRQDTAATAKIIDSIGSAFNEVVPSLGLKPRFSNSANRYFDVLIAEDADPLFVLKACIEWPGLFRKSSIVSALLNLPDTLRYESFGEFGVGLNTLLAIAEVALEDDGLTFFRKLSTHSERRISIAAAAAGSAVGDEDSARRLIADAARIIRSGGPSAEAGEELIMAARSRSRFVRFLLNPLLKEKSEVASYAQIALLCAIGFIPEEAEAYLGSLPSGARTELGRSLGEGRWDEYLANGILRSEIPIPRGLWRTGNVKVLEAVAARLSEESLGEARLLAVAELAASGDTRCRAEMWEWMTRGSIGFLENLRGDLLMVGWEEDCFEWWRAHATTTRERIFSAAVHIERSFFEISFGSSLDGLDMETIDERMERGLARFGGEWRRSRVFDKFIPVPK